MVSVLVTFKPPKNVGVHWGHMQSWGGAHAVLRGSTKWSLWVLLSYRKTRSCNSTTVLLQDQRHEYCCTTTCNWTSYSFLGHCLCYGMPSHLLKWYLIPTLCACFGPCVWFGVMYFFTGWECVLMRCRRRLQHTGAYSSP